MNKHNQRPTPRVVREFCYGTRRDRISCAMLWMALLCLFVLRSSSVTAQSLQASAQSGTIVCIGGTTTVTITATGGQPPYQYSLDGTTFQGSNSLTNVMAGSYTQITVTDAHSSSVVLGTITIADGTTPFTTWYADVDADGYGDASSTVQACAGPAPAGYTSSNTDCNDLDNLISPAATETCNGVDDNCNGLVDDIPGSPLYYTDNDGDGYGTGTGIPSCYDPGNGWSLTGGDCNDANNLVFPTQTEVCNGVDDDCDASIDDGLVFENYWTDADGDQYGSGNPVSLCQDPGIGFATNNADCNDGNPAINPAATETCNGIDDNCNGLLDSSDPLLASAGTLTLTAMADPILCYGSTTDVVLTPSGGVSPYTFGPQPTESLGAGTYTFTVTDVNGCTGAAGIVLGQPTPILTSSINTPIACNGGTSIITVSATGGTGSLSGTGSYIRSAGAYSYTVTDDNGCTAVVTGTLSEPSPLLITESYDPIACNAGTTDVTISASGGTAPYTGTGIVVESAGWHTYTVTDNNGCFASIQFSISEPDPLVLSSFFQPIAVFGGTTSVTIAVTGGTAPYQGTGIFTQASGTRTYEVIDANGCREVISVTLVEPGQLSATATVGTINCFGGTTSLSITANGGVPPYTNTGTYQVSAGPYAYTVTDANGATFSVSGIVQQPAALTANAVAAPMLCQGGSTAVSISATGGTPPYSGTGTFNRSVGTWSFTVTDANGCTAITSISVMDGPTVMVTATQTAMPLCHGDDATVLVTAIGGGGSYIGTGIYQVPAGGQTFTVTDNNGCVGSATLTIVEPDALAIQTLPVNVACHGASTGQISLNITGGTNPMSALWSNGSTQLNAAGLVAGSYTVVVTDGNGCTQTASAALTQPAPLTDLDPIQGVTSACVPYAAGSNPYSVSPISDGVNTTSYSWSAPIGMTVSAGQGTATATLSWTSTAVDPSISGLVTVQASNGCVIKTTTLHVTYSIVSPVTPPSISGPSKLCPGDTGVYSISQVLRATCYVWTFPTGMTLIGSGSGNVVTVVVDGAYTGGSISVAAKNACGTSPVRTRSTVLNTLPAPGVITGQTSGLCGVDSVPYTILPVSGATSYLWTIPANSYFRWGQGTSGIGVNFNGSSGGSIKVQAINACGSSPERSLTVNTIPARPDVISASGPPCAGTVVGYSVPTVVGAFGYNWTTTSGAVIQSGQGTKSISLYWNPTAAGTSQTMVVRASNPCGLSNSRALTLTVSSCLRDDGITNTLSEDFAVYPNPTGGQVYIRFDSTSDQPVRVRILDLTGRLISASIHGAQSGINIIDCGDALFSVSGIYFIEVEQGGRSHRTRVMVE